MIGACEKIQDSSRGMIGVLFVGIDLRTSVCARGNDRTTRIWRPPQAAIDHYHGLADPARVSVERTHRGLGKPQDSSPNAGPFGRLRLASALNDRTGGIYQSPVNRF